GVRTGARETATVERVVDGDTIIAETGGHTQRVRILGIDTPETVHPDKPVECFGPEASDFAHELLDDQTITLRADPTQQDIDRYDRALRYVILPDGTDYSVAAAAAGTAELYTYQDNPVREANRIERAADQAREQGIGMWGAC
ncbi:MAG: thermonuclease family protein, partial [Tomitella sp.]|nr:thermonuclease family protein [Tomitella sp.]